MTNEFQKTVQRTNRLIANLTGRKTIDPINDQEDILKKQQLTEITSKIRDYVKNRKKEAASFKCFWIVGQSGAGKSQSLVFINDDLRRSIEDGDTIAISQLNINQGGLSNDAEKKIFSNMFSPGSFVSDKSQRLYSDTWLFCIR